ncbi:hypothetical protein ACV334_33550, partial [Pseudomonas aeruginosa]
MVEVEIPANARLDYPRWGGRPYRQRLWLVEGLLDCVEGGASVSFMWPLPRERALAFWHGVGESVAGDERLLLVAEAEGRIVGTVQLLLDQPPNQPHRAD